MSVDYIRERAGINAVLQQIRNERLSQITKWGIQKHSARMWLAILTEELGEVAKEIAESQFKPLDADAYRTELTHVAAVAVAAIQSLE